MCIKYIREERERIEIMKKNILLVLMALLSVNLFARDVKQVTKKEDVVVKQFESKVFPVHYKITQDKNNQAILSITDDSEDNLEVRVFVDTVDEAFDWYFDVEGNLLAAFIDGRKDEAVMDLVSKNPLFFMIVSFYDADCEWVRDGKTNRYYYKIDERTFTPSTPLEEAEEKSRYLD